MAVATRDTFNLFVQCIGKVPDPSLTSDANNCPVSIQPYWCT